MISATRAATFRANAKIDLADIIGDWKNSIHLEGLYGRSDEITSAERWAAIVQSDVKFTPRAFAFAALHFMQDEFSGFPDVAERMSGAEFPVQ